MAGRPIRLGKAAGELNVGLPTIVEFLSSKGITIDTNPNTKLDKEHYEMLCDEFAADQDLKEKSKGVLTNREKRESLSIEDTKKEEAPVVKEEPQLNVEEIKRKVAEEEAPEKPDAGLKVVGNIDLNALKPKQKAEAKTTENSTDAPVDAPKKETPKAEEADAAPEKEVEVKKEEEAPEKKEEIETIKIERKKITGPTVLGKIELPVEKPKSSGNSKADHANPFKNSDFDPNIYIDTMGWDPEIANSYTKTLLDMEKSKNRVFPLRVPGVFEFTSAVATGTSKALAGQLSPQEALDEVAKEWEAIVKRVGKKAVQDAYAVGVKMEDNKL